MCKDVLYFFMFAINTHCILPHPILQPYVRCFAVRRFDTEGHEIPKPMIANHEMTMAFFFQSRLFNFKAIDKNAIPYVVKKNRFTESCFAGAQTFTKGSAIFKGSITLLNIHFKPVGFFHIFNICPKELVDKLGDIEDILSNEFICLQEQMHEAATCGESLTLLENFLIQKILSQKPKYRHKGITGASNFLLQKKGTYAIKRLANQCNMTLQTFEVQFAEQVGLNPKCFSRLLRFGSAVETKLYQPFRRWTDIANICGYYDQTHFIKDFKEFTFLSPKKFFKTMHPISETFDDDRNAAFTI